MAVPVVVVVAHSGIHPGDHPPVKDPRYYRHLFPPVELQTVCCPHNLDNHRSPSFSLFLDL